MDDIVERLRAAAKSGDLALGQSFDCLAVADEMERMRVEMERLRVAGNLLAAALRAETINGHMAVCDGTHEALDAWEARRG